ncbi:2-C-methyl-D-erythritol 4-phosphate cytidylyltransferase [Vibrio sp.]|uniref:2-C-methyl-D-erythritol 4-phosphate cytidylyltransferase n=1 Tax=Vibrio viridaestus TaxID=2487322 RepID=A0A3N9TG89_9VIBR|nr:2-C-methyl-D-erythritol 4-phosphate cytidylyltransferase [Vibrio viridaestus]MDC0611171.1 2-C-methyl-D-erythritol 4-phosphate cytidylyltransferase [Vibrio sp.]RQW62914.1 2-C-methyl-D-erythritol 4-phosphate cytidylyltransferase [Vibrio viridaestus]
MTESRFTAIVPAAGVGARMKADKPKQYLKIQGKTILEHTVEKLLSHPGIENVVVAISIDDPYFDSLALAKLPNVIRVDGGAERSQSVLNALTYVVDNSPSHWVLVHDAARPCVELSDISRLITEATEHPVGAILAAPVRDTMKRSNAKQDIDQTIDRSSLWHALTPQMFRSEQLKEALTQALFHKVAVTDEASAMEWLGLSPRLVTGRMDNLKITQPEDLSLAEFYLTRDKG